MIRMFYTARSGIVGIFHVMVFMGFLGPQLLFGSTVVPFDNLGEMALSGSAVVLAYAVENVEYQDGSYKRERTKFVLRDNIKGRITETFYVQNMEYTIGEWYRKVSGDVKFETGKSYFMILEPVEGNVWKTKMLSYGVLVEKIKKDEKLLVPVEESVGLEVSVPTRNKSYEALGVYWSDSLLYGLERFLDGKNEWREERVLSPYSVEDFQGITTREAPSHCNNLNSGTPVRWNIFPDNVLPVYGHQDGDADLSGVNSVLSSAVSELENQYDVINLNYQGTHSYEPSGTDDSAYDNDDFFNEAIDKILVQYNDPVEEINDLSGCSGTLAIGGAFWSTGSTHTFQGEEWYTIRAGFVVVNNGVGNCLNTTEYEQMLTHEVTHALGMDHIAASFGTANMNPSCCSDITSLDIECMDYTYVESEILPYELISFSGDIEDEIVTLNWETANEINTSHFDIEQSTDGRNFTTLSSVESYGNGSAFSYNFKHPVAEKGILYFRLHQWDKNGDASFSNTIQLINSLERHLGQLSIYPNPVNNLLNVKSDGKKGIRYTIVNATGRILQSGAVSNTPIPTNSLGPGIYFIRLVSGAASTIHKFIVK